MSALVRFPVSVIMERKEISRGRWTVPSWQAVGVVAGGHVASPDARKTPVRFDGDGQRFLWSGFSLDLYRDCTENYRHNLISDHPSLFVICAETPDGELEPTGITANLDESSSHVESDYQVFSVPMPPEIYKLLEGFVVEHHLPEEKRVRRRKNWSKSSGR